MVPSGGVGPTLVFDLYAVDDTGGNDNGFVDPNECLGLRVSLRNSGGDPATGVTATLGTTTPDVTIQVDDAGWADIAAGATGASTPFRFQTEPGFVPGTVIALSLDVVTDQGPFTIPFTVTTGNLATTLFSATGPVPIPDNNPAGATLNIAVSGVADPITKVRVATRITHTWDGDLTLSLVGPNSTTVVLSDERGGSGDNYGTDCPADDGDDTIFDDGATTAIGSGLAPFVGSFIPEQPLAAFNGLSGANVNGTWQFRVVDAANLDTGNIECTTVAIDHYVNAPGPGVCQGRNFYPVPPCRVADTRSTAPPALVANASRDFGLGGVCGIPADATAVAVNVSVTGSTAPGHLRLHAAGTPTPPVATLNFGAGQTRGNNAVVTLGTAGEITVFSFMQSGTVHFILDVTGYFR